MNPDDLEAAKLAAKRLRAAFPGLQGVGVGDGCLHVYLRTRKEGRGLPETFEGWPIRAVVVGQIVAAHATVFF